MSSAPRQPLELFAMDGLLTEEERAIRDVVRDFVDRIHLGVELFLAERGVERSDQHLPVWRVTEPGRRILLIAHAGTNSVSIGHMLGLTPTPWEWDRFVLGHTSVSRLESMRVGLQHSFSLVRLADVEHLPGDHRTR